jgi:hypothetical protein
MFQVTCQYYACPLSSKKSNDFTEISPLEYISKMSTINRHISLCSGTAMKASIVDLRYKTKDILKALEKNETVTVLYHGKVKGVIKPVKEKFAGKVEDHPFFGMIEQYEETVLEQLGHLRKPRHDL